MATKSPEHSKDLETPASQKMDDATFMKGLSLDEVKRIEKSPTSIHDIKAERAQLAAAAEIKLNEVLRQNTSSETILTDREYLEYQQKIKDTNSPDVLGKMIKDIEELPKTKKKANEDIKEDEKKLDPEDQKLLDIQKDFHDICEKNKDVIGTKQLAEFKAYIESQRKKNPTVAHMKEQLKRLKGEESTDKNGLHPRRLELHKHQSLFKEYHISGGPLSNEYIKKEGLSERTTFRERAEDAEKELIKMQNTGLYSHDAVDNIMQSILEATSPEQQKSIINQANAVRRLESANKDKLDSQMSVQGKVVRKMSEESKRKYLEYYANTKLDEREKLVTNWETLVKHEAKLATDLEDIYKEHYKGDEAKMKTNLHTAISSFGKLDFMAKKEALKEHKTLLEKEENEETIERTLLIKEAHSAINGEPTLSSGTKTRYKDWYTQKYGKDTSDVKALKKANEVLTSATPNEDLQNLSAYSKRHKQYMNDLKVLRDVTPKMTDAEYDKLKNNFYEEGWKKRETLQTKLTADIKDANKKARELKTIQSKAGIKEGDKDKLEKGEALKGCLDKAKDLLLKGQAAEALKELASFDDPGNPEIVKAMKAAVAFLDAFGAGQAANDNVEKEVEDAMEERLSSDKRLKTDVLEEQISTLNIKGVEQSQRKNDNILSAEDRAAKEALEATADETEKDMVESFNEQKDDGYILDQELTGEEVTTIEISDTEGAEAEMNKLKKETYGDQDRLITKEGLLTKLQDKTGREISTDEAKSLQEKNLEQIEEDMAETSLKDVESKSAKGTNISDLNSRITARRTAQRLLDEKRHEKIKNAA